jgi:hypothetical protein
MGVYMEPLIDELIRTWEEGVWMYTEHEGAPFLTGED